MKTISQYREDIKALMDKSAAVDAKATNENRDLTEAEIAHKKDLLARAEELHDMVATLEHQERLHATLSAPAGGPASRPKKTEGIDMGVDNRAKDRFVSFGEQLFAVKNASTNQGVDPRLFNIRGATGLNESVSSDGGFLVQQDFSSELLEDVFQTGILAQKCRRQPISGNSNGIKINGVDETSRASSRFGGIVGYWLNEAGTKTASRPKFRKIDLELKKLIGLCYATDELLQDAPALEAYIRAGFASEFGYLTDNAIINGTGAGEPLGIMNAGCLVTVSKEAGQAADTVVTENIVKMYARRFASQSSNYVWLYNQDIEPQLLTMSLAVGTGGVPVYMPPGGLRDEPFGRILGRPALAIEQAATLGDAGDIILANFANGYIVAEKGGIKSDMSIHVQFIYDESVFRFVLRIDGQPVRATALTPAKGSNTQSHFITLEAR